MPRYVDPLPAGPHLPPLSPRKHGHTPSVRWRLYFYHRYYHVSPSRVTTTPQRANIEHTRGAQVTPTLNWDFITPTWVHEPNRRCLHERRGTAENLRAAARYRRQAFTLPQTSRTGGLRLVAVLLGAIANFVSGLKKLVDWPTYPQLFVKGEFAEGLDIVQEMADISKLTYGPSP